MQQARVGNGFDSELDQEGEIIVGTRVSAPHQFYADPDPGL